MISWHKIHIVRVQLNHSQIFHNGTQWICFGMIYLNGPCSNLSHFSLSINIFNKITIQVLRAGHINSVKQQSTLCSHLAVNHLGKYVGPALCGGLPLIDIGISILVYITYVVSNYS
jgi:hypothetical protein